MVPHEVHNFRHEIVAEKSRRVYGPIFRIDPLMTDPSCHYVVKMVDRSFIVDLIPITVIHNKDNDNDGDIWIRKDRL